MFSLEVHVMDQCNLNCKGCTHFCPIVPKDTPPVNIDNIIRDLLRLNAIHCTPYELKILGGEPLMHPELTDKLKDFRGAFPNSKIYIWTNGLLLPKMHRNFFVQCEMYDIGIKITPYYQVKDSVEIKNLMEMHKFIEFDDWFEGKFWKSPLSVHETHAGINYAGCRIKYGRCNILRDGKIFQCAFPAYAHYLNQAFGLNLELDEGDYVDIYDIQNERDFINRLYQPTHFCRYCSNENYEDMDWEHSKKQAGEFIQTI